MTTSDFGWRGWALVGLLVVSFLVVPWAIIALPGAGRAVSALGLGFKHTYLVLPLLPALLLGVVAVWAAVGERGDG
ncbi:hypothetical protein VB773_08320 [Haloarculaceae archaeon H-GB2-1]|nr:hypothetical protein [Haloarculaceae archaeon H-GB1-1]MEA5386062.1 hypothetical protein [Haloarculaceae archaeon H-GB11]MEA5407569.1 hypothetical protein [Haloarculaceae archaeon H-GB2-1]